MKKNVAEGIVVFLILGAITNGLAVWRETAIITEKLKVVEKKQGIQDNTNKEMRQKIDALHWYLIESKGVKVPTKDK